MIMIVIKVLIIVLIFKIITTTSTVIITDYYSKWIRSSYKYCFPHCSFCEKKMLFNLSVVFKKSGNLFQILGTTY